MSKIKMNNCDFEGSVSKNKIRHFLTEMVEHYFLTTRIHTYSSPTTPATAIHSHTGMLCEMKRQVRAWNVTVSPVSAVAPVMLTFTSASSDCPVGVTVTVADVCVRFKTNGTNIGAADTADALAAVSGVPPSCAVGDAGPCALSRMTVAEVGLTQIIGFEPCPHTPTGVVLAEPLLSSRG